MRAAGFTSRTVVARAARVVTSAGFAGWGLLLLARPVATVQVVAGGPVPPEVVVRVLGARRVAQHLVVGATSSVTIAWAAVATDVLHAASVVAGARLWPTYRRAQLTSAAIATTSAALTALVAVAGRNRSEDAA